MNQTPLGIYRHYKGNQYEVVASAKHSEALVRACSVSWFNGFFKQIDVFQGSVDNAYSLRTLGNADAEERKISKKAVKDEILNRL